MRMWYGIHPEIPCRQHLVGEHGELHMFYGAITKGKSVKGYLETGVLEPLHLKERHDLLAQEMLRRGYQHKSPFIQPAIPDSFFKFLCHKSPEDHLKDLLSRCNRCRNRYEKFTLGELQ